MQHLGSSQCSLSVAQAVSLVLAACAPFIVVIEDLQQLCS